MFSGEKYTSDLHHFRPMPCFHIFICKTFQQWKNFKERFNSNFQILLINVSANVIIHYMNKMQYRIGIPSTELFG